MRGSLGSGNGDERQSSSPCRHFTISLIQDVNRTLTNRSCGIHAPRTPPPHFRSHEVSPRDTEVPVLPLTTAVIGFLLGLGGLRELLVDGIWYGQLQPLLVGAAGALVSSLLLLAALAIWLRWSRWPRLATFAGALSIVFHIY